jgi:hypothetical protein
MTFKGNNFIYIYIIPEAHSINEIIDIIDFIKIKYVFL